GHPNEAFVQKCFTTLPQCQAVQLRVYLQHLLDQQWWRQDIPAPNKSDLDTFIERTDDDEFHCLFCDSLYMCVNDAYGCIKKHLDITG
ncbi:hypothetical protein CPB86DRAFT_719416, partial [Serendipita vermifera]